MRPQVGNEAASDVRIVTSALLRTAKLLAISNKSLAAIIGISEPSVSRLSTGVYELADKPFELSLLVIRLFRSLDAITGGDHDVACQWLRNENSALGVVPLDAIQTIVGLTNVVSYLDARRAIV